MEDVEEAALAAVADLITEVHPGAMVAKFVLIAEVIGGDGEWAVWTATSPDQRQWDTLGLLAYATQVEMVAVAAEGYDDDD